jgi:hypothetical protein
MSLKSIVQFMGLNSPSLWTIGDEPGGGLIGQASTPEMIAVATVYYGNTVAACKLSREPARTRVWHLLTLISLLFNNARLKQLAIIDGLCVNVGWYLSRLVFPKLLAYLVAGTVEKSRTHWKGTAVAHIINLSTAWDEHFSNGTKERAAFETALCPPSQICRRESPTPAWRYWI